MSASTDQKIGAKVFNVPNQLTAARFVLAVVCFVLIPLEYYFAALIIFIIAASTDWIDGWWARRYDQVTQLGRIFDPFVDKIIICGTFVLLAIEIKVHMGTWDRFPWYARMYGWVAVVVVAREMLVTALRSFIEKAGGDFSAQWAGKLKMVFQCAAVVASLIVLHLYEPWPEKPIEPWLIWGTAACVWLAVISTIYSGIGYIIAAAKFIRE